MGYPSIFFKAQHEISQPHQSSPYKKADQTQNPIEILESFDVIPAYHALPSQVFGRTIYVHIPTKVDINLSYRLSNVSLLDIKQTKRNISILTANS